MVAGIRPVTRRGSRARSCTSGPGIFGMEISEDWASFDKCMTRSLIFRKSFGATPYKEHNIAAFSDRSWSDSPYIIGRDMVLKRPVVLGPQEYVGSTSTL